MKQKCAPQFMGLPYMAHESHAEDTLFIIAEPDFMFTEADATAQAHWWEQEESLHNRYADLGRGVRHFPRHGPGCIPARPRQMGGGAA